MSSWKGNNISHISQASSKQNHKIKTKAEASVLDCSVAAKIQVPFILFSYQSQFLNPATTPQLKYEKLWLYLQENEDLSNITLHLAYRSAPHFGYLKSKSQPTDKFYQFCYHCCNDFVAHYGVKKKISFRLPLVQPNQMQRLFVHRHSGVHKMA